MQSKFHMMTIPTCCIVMTVLLCRGQLIAQTVRFVMIVSYCQCN